MAAKRVYAICQQGFTVYRDYDSSKKDFGGKVSETEATLVNTERLYIRRAIEDGTLTVVAPAVIP
jgi:hypothetical protein